MNNIDYTELITTAFMFYLLISKIAMRIKMSKLIKENKKLNETIDKLLKYGSQSGGSVADE